MCENLMEAQIMSITITVSTKQQMKANLPGHISYSINMDETQKQTQLSVAPRSPQTRCLRPGQVGHYVVYIKRLVLPQKSFETLLVARMRT